MGQRQALSSTLWAKLCKPNRMHAAYIHIDCPVNVYLDNNRVEPAKTKLEYKNIYFNESQLQFTYNFPEIIMCLKG